ncbi:hypothetical protein GCM10023198_12130 [Promicromonospora umidemergens]|uniref:Transposase n=1 Tax=Promicromonospora umidemergens TaxID=629679 RepID=A0ABP8WST8_9MICO
MPRRRPVQVRRLAARRLRTYRPTQLLLRYVKDRRLSGPTHAAISLAERLPGEVFAALQNWDREARTRNPWSRRAYGCGARECRGSPLDDRDLLERTIHRLPRRPARELRALVRELDRRILAKFPVQLDHYHRWWHADFPWDYD